jgi:hypothetical protein
MDKISVVNNEMCSMDREATDKRLIVMPQIN